MMKSIIRTEYKKRKVKVGHQSDQLMVNGLKTIFNNAKNNLLSCMTI